jgi:hypothetical protein
VRLVRSLIRAAPALFAGGTLASIDADEYVIVQGGGERPAALAKA